MRIIIPAVELPAYFLKRKLATNAITIIGMSRYSSMTVKLKNTLKFQPSDFAIKSPAFFLLLNSPSYLHNNCWQRLLA